MQRMRSNNNIGYFCILFCFLFHSTKQCPPGVTQNRLGGYEYGPPQPSKLHVVYVYANCNNSTPEPTKLNVTSETVTISNLDVSCQIPNLSNGKLFIDGEAAQYGSFVQKGVNVILMCQSGYQNSPNAKYTCSGFNEWEPRLLNCSSWKLEQEKSKAEKLFNDNVLEVQNSLANLTTDSRNIKRFRDKMDKVPYRVTESSRSTTSKVLSSIEIDSKIDDYNYIDYPDVLNAKPVLEYDDFKVKVPKSVGTPTSTISSGKQNTTTPSNKKFDRDLGRLVSRGRRRQVESALARNADINIGAYSDGNCGWGSSKQPPLMVAVACNRSLDFIKYLVDNGADVNGHDEFDHSVLNAAALKTTPAVVHYLMKKGADVNAVANDGFSPLTWATIGGDLRIIWELLIQGADPNQRDIDGWSPLIEASNKTRPDIVRLLLKHGADPNAKTNDQYTSLIYASSRGDDESVGLLLKKGAEPNAVATDGSTALIWATINGNADTIRLLLACHADVNIKDNEGYTPLLWAITYNKVNVVKLLLIDENLDVDIADREGVTPLMIATKNFMNETFHLLLERGADVDSKDNDGWTALIYASSSGDSRSVPYIKALLKRGADVDASDKGGNTALTYAMEYNNGVMTVFLLLLEHGGDINVRTNSGTTLLMMASQQGHDGLVKMLLDNGAEIDAKDNKGNTALVFAAAASKTSTLKLLRKRGASREGCMYYICSTV